MKLTQKQANEHLARDIKKYERLREGKLTKGQQVYLDTLAMAIQMRLSNKIHAVVAVSFGLGVGEWRYDKGTCAFEFDAMNYGD